MASERSAIKLQVSYTERVVAVAVVVDVSFLERLLLRLLLLLLVAVLLALMVAALA
jgi:hypothetical protein